MAIREDLIRDFEFLKYRKDILAVLLFGSHAKGESTERSDIDICIVAPGAQREKLLSLVLSSLSNPEYHVWLFEELPLYMKKEVMENHKIILCEDKPKLYEYFYFVNKLWRDQEHRQRITREELKAQLAKSR